MKVKAKAPGKQMLFGEWAILNHHNSCIVQPVAEYVEVSVSPTEENTIYLNFSDLNIHQECYLKDHQLYFQNELNKEQADQVIFTKVILQNLSYLFDIKQIEINSKSTATLCPLSGKKIGFGSSAAFTVACIKALSKYYNQNLNDLTVFKLAAYCHFQAQGKIGSNFDIAAASFNQLIAYSPPQPEIYETNIESTADLEDYLNQDWSSLSILKLNNPDLKFLSVFTGKSADTRKLVNLFKSNSERTPNTSKILEKINQNTLSAIQNWGKLKLNDLNQLIANNNNYLKDFSDLHDLSLFTPEIETCLQIAKQHDYAAKFSGAGGGDCCIIAYQENDPLTDLLAELKDNHLSPLFI